MTSIAGLLSLAINIYIFLIIGRALLSWFPLRSGTAAYTVYGWLYDVTEPYLGIFRRILPPVRMGNAALDLSPILGFVVLLVVQRLIVRIG
ncbi:MAG TPA: YggT family protein [Thermoleophilia bacterium]|nr:YggT family protein [Thermoleophilia bacterium]